jgi:phosphoglycerate-specific signal transduction histidine kinase
MLLSKLVYISIPLVLVNVLVNTIGAANTFYMFLGLVTLYGYNIYYKQEVEDLQDFFTENCPSPTSSTQARNIIDEIDEILENEFADNEQSDDDFVDRIEYLAEEVVEEFVEDVQEVVKEISPILQEVANEIIEQVADQKIENIAPAVLENVDEIIEEVVPESIAPIVEEVVNESAPVVEEAVEEAVQEIVENKEEGKWFSIGPWSN